MVTELEPGERPQAVSVIAWLTLVFSALVAAKALIDLAVWKAMGPAVPRLLGMSGDPTANVPYVRTIVAHITEIKIAQAILWMGVAFIAIGLLRLRPWARVAMQVVGVAMLLYFAGILIAWGFAWNAPPPADPAVPPLSGPARMTVLAAGSALLIFFGIVMVWMIVILRRPRIRAAFDASA